jgi:hypothetical protein
MSELLEESDIEPRERDADLIEHGGLHKRRDKAVAALQRQGLVPPRFRFLGEHSLQLVWQWYKEHEDADSLADAYRDACLIVASSEKCEKDLNDSFSARLAWQAMVYRDMIGRRILARLRQAAGSSHDDESTAAGVSGPSRSSEESAQSGEVRVKMRSWFFRS